MKSSFVKNIFQTFINDLFSDAYGAVDTATIEIGNEYFQDFRFTWSTAEFGAFQAEIARIVDDELRDMGLREDLTLLAQGGHVRNNNTATTTANNAQLAQHFEDLPQGTVDGVTLHFYGTRAHGTDDPLQMVPNIQDVVDGTNATWGPVIGDGFPAGCLSLFIDDLQWADAHSLKLMEDIILRQELAERLLIVGACRGNEVSLGDELSVVLRRLEDERGIQILDIKLRK